MSPVHKCLVGVEAYIIVAYADHDMRYCLLKSGKIFQKLNSWRLISTVSIARCPTVLI